MNACRELEKSAKQVNVKIGKVETATLCNLIFPCNCKTLQAENKNGRY